MRQYITLLVKDKVLAIEQCGVYTKEYIKELMAETENDRFDRLWDEIENCL